MSSLIKMPHELPIDEAISCLIYGEPGVGKTTLALSAEAPVLIDMDRGMQRVDRRLQCPCVRADSYAQILELFDGDEISCFKTIVIDPFDRMLDSIIAHLAAKNSKILAADGSVNIRAWGTINAECKRFLNLVRSQKKGLIFIAHSQVEKIGDVERLRPKIPGSSRVELVRDLDLVGYMCISKGRRTIFFNKNDDFWSKESACLTEPVIIPESADAYNKLKTFYSTDIYGAVVRYRAEMARMKAEYDELLSAQDAILATIVDVDTLNIAYASLKAIEKPIWDSITVWKRALQAKAQELGAGYNKSKDVFEVCLGKSTSGRPTQNASK